MEAELMKYIYEYLKGLHITDCDVYLSRPTIMGDKEKRKSTYVIVSFPNGIIDNGAFQEADGIITIGAKDRVIGLPQINEISRVSNIIKNGFPILTDDYSFLDYEFSSDDSVGTGYHEYYYTFHVYINKSN